MHRRNHNTRGTQGYYSSGEHKPSHEMQETKRYSSGRRYVSASPSLSCNRGSDEFVPLIWVQYQKLRIGTAPRHRLEPAHQRTDRSRNTIPSSFSRSPSPLSPGPQISRRLVTTPEYLITLCVSGAGRFGHGSPSVNTAPLHVRDMFLEL